MDGRLRIGRERATRGSFGTRSRPARRAAVPAAVAALSVIVALASVAPTADAQTPAASAPPANAAAPSSATAAAPSRSYARELAATCAHCHGTDGRALAGEAMVPLAGQPKDQLYAQLMAFRGGERPATVMHQIARGYSPQQLEQIAAYFAAQKK